MSFPVVVAGYYSVIAHYKSHTVKTISLRCNFETMSCLSVYGSGHQLHQLIYVSIYLFIVTDVSAKKSAQTTLQILMLVLLLQFI